MLHRFSRTAALLAAFSAATGCGGDTTAPDQAPSITFDPEAVVFSARSSDVRIPVQATITGVGDQPTLRWISLAPEAIAIDSVRQGGTSVVLRGVAPRTTFIVLTATGTRTVTDSLPVAIAGASAR